MFSILSIVIISLITIIFLVILWFIVVVNSPNRKFEFEDNSNITMKDLMNELGGSPYNDNNNHQQEIKEPTVPPPAYEETKILSYNFY